MHLKGKKRISKLTSRLLILECLFVTIAKCNGQEHNRCSLKETCAECIGEDPLCGWCSEEVTKSRGKSRCDTLENLKQDGCNKTVDPRNSVKITRNKALSQKGAKAGEAVQIMPQEMEIYLRPNSIQNFKVTYRQAVDYPVDLYLLMDLSYTMKDDLEKLGSLGETLGAEMQPITSDFRLGFGSFVEKVVAPFSETHPHWIETPCKIRGKCVRSYSFKNHMRLSSDITKFIQEVNDSKVSSNIDTPEGTLDAIMQVIVCKNEIGWREKSRKLIVIATDGDFHYAGDGKMGGVIEPNDCKCHLDSNGMYTMSDQLDYPSLNQMKETIKEHDVYLIFAVPQQRVDNYQILMNRITATTVGKLESDSSNIVDLIKEQYNKISSKIEMTERAARPHNISFSYHSECLNEPRKEKRACIGLKPGDTVTFDVSVGISMCPKNEEDWKTTIEIHPVGLSENLAVKFTIICKCDCKEDAGKEAENRRKWCSGKGTFECGICRCDDTSFGDSCQCDTDGNQTQTDSSECKYGNDEVVCFGRGTCECGKCFCNEEQNSQEKYYGKYCECSNSDCYQINRKICNGQGTCDCGTCKCNKGWSGQGCECYDSTENCILQTGEDVCSGHGTCNCGSCVCNDAYYGKFCEDCLACEGKCEKYGNCVKCALSAEPGRSLLEQCESCEGANVEIIDEIEVNDTQEEKVCITHDENNCRVTFKYRMDDSFFFQAQSTRECPKPVDLILVASSTVGGVLIAGIVMLLMWKILTEVHDRREWSKFQNDLDNAQWDSGNNPIFIEPTSTFQNPAFGNS